MTFLASWLASPAPDAAIELGADRVSATVLTVRGDGPVVSAYAVEPLRPGALMPSLTGANVQDKTAVVGTLRRAIEKLETRVRRVALIVPDTAVKVSLLRFDTVPPRRDDFDQLVRWQLRKAAPFPVESAIVTYSPALAVPNGGSEFLVEVARQECVREYESVCEEAGLYAGLVDTATFSLLGAFVDGRAIQGDWLLVHARPDYTSIAIVRDDVVIFYRHRAEDGQETLADLVHQTAMYHQDRLSGGSFARVYLAGAGRAAAAADADRIAIEGRLGVAVQTFDPTRAASLTGRIAATPDLMDALGPSIGLLRRTLTGVVA